MTRTLAFSLLAFVLTSTNMLAQTPSPALKVRPNEPPKRPISLDVVVTSKDGKPMNGLEEKDFKIFDNKEPKAITSFRAYDGSQEPVEMILLIDSINTGFNVVAQERIEIDRFLHADGGKLAHPMTLAVLTNKGVQMQGAYVRDGNLLADSLDKYTIGFRTIGQSAGSQGDAERLQDSLKALRMLTSYETGRPGRKIILWVSPGWPSLSNPHADISSAQEQGVFNQVTWFATHLREAQTTIDSVNPLGVGESPQETFFYQQFVGGLKKPQDANYGNLGVQVIATETGGLVLSSSDVFAPLQQCVADAGAYYRITFEPPPAERRDAYHRVEVKTGDPALTARTTTGYYATP